LDLGERAHSGIARVFPSMSKQVGRYWYQGEWSTENVMSLDYESVLDNQLRLRVVLLQLECSFKRILRLLRSFSQLFLANDTLD
jgi:hypothetical protein